MKQITYLYILHKLKDAPQWIFPEGASRQRGRFELAFGQIGGAVMAGNGIHCSKTIKLLLCL